MSQLLGIQMDVQLTIGIKQMEPAWMSLFPGATDGNIQQDVQPSMSRQKFWACNAQKIPSVLMNL